MNVRIPVRVLALAFGVAAFLFGGSMQARADILLTISSGATTDSFDVASNTLAFANTTLAGYNVNVETVITNFPGAPTNAGISTTVNILGPVAAGAAPLFVTAQLIAAGAVAPGGPYITPPFPYSAQPLLPWSAPSVTPVMVSAGSNLVPNVSVTSGTVTTTTYYNSPPAATFAGSTGVVTATTAFPPFTGVLNSVSEPNSGTFSLSQTVELSGVNAGAQQFNFGGTSNVTVVPEPATIIGAATSGLMFLGYSLKKRRKARIATA